jgi:two-component system, NarL family, sensor histidine kinase UhpB
MTGNSLFNTTHPLPYLAGNPGYDLLMTIAHRGSLTPAAAMQQLSLKNGWSGWEETIRNQERKYIGHELHDNVNQILSSAKLFADMLCPLNDQEKEIKEKIIAYMMMAISEIRQLSAGLVDSTKTFGRLKDKIQVIIDDLRFTTGTWIEFNYCNELESLDTERKVMLLRTVQEQLKNIMSHSRATQVRVHMQYVNGNAMLLIKDNGVGFDTSGTRTGIGLSGICDRVACFNGTIELQSSPGNGCSLLVSIPISD